jgi:hypothetical protein
MLQTSVEIVRKGGNGKPALSSGQTGALAAEQVLHVAVAVGLPRRRNNVLPDFDLVALPVTFLAINDSVDRLVKLPSYFFNGAGAPPPARADADAFRLVRMTASYGVTSA